jgi:tetratricopeptide (TPR) repeat protein
MDSSQGARAGSWGITHRGARYFWFMWVVLLLKTAATAQQPAAACAKARPYISGAQAALAAADSTTALQKLNQATTIDPKCAEAYLLLGLTEFHGGATADSIRHYQQALALQPRSYSGHYDLALAYLKQQNLPEARVQLEQAVRLDPRQADAAYDLGMVLLEMGEPSGALVQLRHARVLNPKRPDVAFNIVRAELEAGQVTEAQAEATDSAKHFGSDVQWTASIGQLFLQKGNPKEAAFYLLQTRRVRPDDLEIRHQLALAYLQSSQSDQVLSTITEPKTSDDYYLRASAFYLSKRFHEADQDSESALELAPDSAQVLVLRTRLLQRAGEQSEALSAAQRAIAAAPKWDQPYYLAGVSYYFLRHYEQAQESLARAVELNPDSARALFLEAIALANLGKPGEAEQCLRRAIALQPTNARLHCHLGIFLARRNENTQALESFRKAIQLKPEYGLSHYELGKLLVASSQWQPAAQELEQAVRYDPGLSAAYYQLVRVYAKLGEAEKSKEMLAEFQKLHKQEENDIDPADQAQDNDARKETDPQ